MPSARACTPENPCTGWPGYGAAGLPVKKPDGSLPGTKVSAGSDAQPASVAPEGSGSVDGAAVAAVADAAEATIASPAARAANVSGR